MSDRHDLIFTGPVISDLERSLINLLRDRKTQIGLRTSSESEGEAATSPVSPQDTEKEESEKSHVSPEEVECMMKATVGEPHDRDLALLEGPSLLHSLQKELVFVQQPLPVALQERLSHHPAYQPQVEPEVATLIGELNRKELGSRGSGGCRPAAAAAWVNTESPSNSSTFQDVVVVDLEKSDPFLHDTLSLMDPAIVNLHSAKPPEKNSSAMGVASSVEDGGTSQTTALPEATPLTPTPNAASLLKRGHLGSNKVCPQILNLGTSENGFDSNARMIPVCPKSTPGTPSCPHLSFKLKEDKENFPKSYHGTPNTPRLPKIHRCYMNISNSSIPKKTRIPFLQKPASAKTTTTPTRRFKVPAETTPIKKKWSVASPVAMYIHQSTPRTQGPLKEVQEASLAQRAKQEPPSFLPVPVKKTPRDHRPATAPAL